MARLKPRHVGAHRHDRSVRFQACCRKSVSESLAERGARLANHVSPGLGQLRLGRSNLKPATGSSPGGQSRVEALPQNASCQPVESSRQEPPLRTLTRGSSGKDEQTRLVGCHLEGGYEARAFADRFGCGSLSWLSVRYDLPALARYLAISLPLLVLLMGGFTFVLGAVGLSPSLASLERAGLARPEALPIGLSVAGWLIETLALTALFLLIQDRTGAWWIDGLVAGMIGWVFRGPILVLTIVSTSRLGVDPWWPMALRLLLLYSICGLALAMIARSVGLER